MFHGLLTAEQTAQAFEIQSNLSDGDILRLMETEDAYKELVVSFLADNEAAIRNAFADRSVIVWAGIGKEFAERFDGYAAKRLRKRLEDSGQILPEIVEDVAGVEVASC